MVLLQPPNEGEHHTTHSSKGVYGLQQEKIAAINNTKFLQDLGLKRNQKTQQLQPYNRTFYGELSAKLGQYLCC